MKRIQRVCIIIIFLLSFILRIYAVSNISYKMEWDTLNYHNMAKNFLENGFLGYEIGESAKEPNAYVTPGYPLFLSFIYSVTDGGGEYGIITVKIVQALLSAFTVLLIYLIAQKIGGFVAGFTAAVFAMIYPAFLVVAVYHLTETLYNFLFCSYLYLQLSAFDGNRKYMHLITGLVFGITVLVRPTIFPIFIIIYIIEAICRKNKKIYIFLVYFAFGLLIIMLPWWIRNFLILGKFILLCTQAGNPLIGGAYPPGFEGNMYASEDQLTNGIKVIISGFINYPYEYIKWFTVGKLKLIFGKVYLAGFLPEFKIFCIVHYLSLFFGLFGTLFGILKNNVRILSEYVIILTVIQLLFIPELRYAFSIMPILMILSGYFISKIKLVRKYYNEVYYKKQRQKNS